MTNQNDLQAVIDRAKADIARKYVFVHMPIPQLETLIAGLEDLKRENERMKEALGYVKKRSEDALDESAMDNYGLQIGLTMVRQRAQESLSTLTCTP